MGVLLDGPSTGYEIKAMMNRSTAYFWRESDSTLYPMLKLLAKEGKVESQVAYVGKKRKEIFAITEGGRAEFEEWLKSPTSGEIRRNEFLLKLFFVEEGEERGRLLRERLGQAEQTYREYQQIEERLKGLSRLPKAAIRLKSLQHGMAHLALDIEWLKGEISRG